MKATPKAKRATPKPTNRRKYYRDYESVHPGLRLRFDSKDQFELVKSAVTRVAPACSLNLFILEAAVSRANIVLSTRSVTAPA